MAVLTVRNVPEEIHRALRLRAAENGRSTEAEVRAILAAAVNPDQRLRIGDALGALGRELDFTDEDVAALAAVRDKASATPPVLP